MQCWHIPILNHKKTGLKSVVHCFSLFNRCIIHISFTSFHTSVISWDSKAVEVLNSAVETFHLSFPSQHEPVLCVRLIADTLPAVVVRALSVTFFSPPTSMLSFYLHRLGEKRGKRNSDTLNQWVVVAV